MRGGARPHWASVTFVNPIGASGSTPFARASADANSWPGTTESSGESSGTLGCGTVSVVGVYAERCEVHMGLAWIKALTLHTGQANVIGHLDRVLALMGAGVLDPAPLVTHHMSLADAPAAYELYDRREALKIVLEP